MFSPCILSMIAPFWKDSFAHGELHLLNAQTVTRVANLGSSLPRQIRESTYEQLQAEAVVSFRLMILSLNKQGLGNFMTQIHQFRYGSDPSQVPRAGIVDHYSSPNLPSSVAPPSIINPDMNRGQGRGRRPNFGEARKTQRVDNTT